MKKRVLSIFFLVISFLIISCADEETPSSPQIEADFNLSAEVIDFGSDLNSVNLDLTQKDSTFKAPWKVEKRQSNFWLDFNYFSGTGSQKIKLSVNRSKMTFGVNTDTIYFKILSSEFDNKGNQIDKVDSTKKIIVKATRIPTYYELVSSQIDNGITLLKSYSDSSFSLNATFYVNYLDKPSTAALAVFKDGSSLFANVGGELDYTINSSSLPNVANAKIPLKTFQYYGSTAGNVSGNYYFDIYPTKERISFDNSTYHVFNINSTNSAVTSYKDSILSVLPIEIKPKPTLITTSLPTFFVYWDSTATPDDSVYVIIHAKNDTTCRAVTAKPVNDNVGFVTFTNAQFGQVKKGGSTAIITIIRFRSKVDLLNRRIFLTQSQSSYSIDLI